MSIPKDRILKVAQISAKIFDQHFNPLAVRTGSKILSSRLKGKSISSYYGNPDFIKFKHLKKIYPGFNFVDEEEEYRLSMIELRKRRGKGAPPKKKEKSSEKSKTQKKK